MKKETLIAVFLGIFLGVIVAGVTLVKNRRNQMRQTHTITQTLRVTPTIIVKNSQFQPLEISQPENQLITPNKAVVIKGKGKKDALIVIQSPIKQVVFVNDKEDFSYQFPLTFGENVIHISLYPKNTQDPIQEKDLKIYQLDEQ